MASDSVAPGEVAAACAAIANDTSSEPQPSAAGAGPAAASNIDSRDVHDGGSQGADGAHPATASATAGPSEDAPSAKAAAAAGGYAAPEMSTAAVGAKGPGDGAAPTSSPSALQPAGSEEVAVALLDSIVGGELGKLDPVSPDTVPPQVSVSHGPALSI